MEDCICRIINLESEINQDMIQLVELKKDIIGRIKAVESMELQTVLELSYLSYICWEEIAREPRSGDASGALTRAAKDLYAKYNSDGKYILDVVRLIICQSNIKLTGTNAYVTIIFCSEEILSAMIKISKVFGMELFSDNVYNELIDLSSEVEPGNS